MRSRLVAVACLAAVGSCGGHLDIPDPSLSPRASAPLPPADPAIIAIPISISLGKIRAAISAKFPPADSLTQAQCVALGGAVCHQYVYRRDSIELRMNGDRIDLASHLRYRGRVALPGVGGLASCGYAPEEMKRAELQAGTALYWRQDWRLASRNTTITASLLDPCQVTLLRVDATPLMRRIVEGQAEKLRAQLDSAVPALADLRPSADSLWRTMLQPMAMDSASTVWLSMSPQGVALARPLGRADAITTAIVLTAKPHASIGEKPNAERRALPVLGIATGTSGIHIPLDIELPFAALSARVSQLMKGEVPGANLTVDSVSVWGVADTMVVRIGVHGSVRGDLYALGRVQYDSVNRHLLVTDLRYTLESDNRMSRIKASLGSFRIKRALDLATGHGQLDVGTQLDSVRRQLSEKLNRPLAPGVTVTGAISDIRIAAFATSSTAFVLRVIVDGNARMDVR